MLSNAAKTLKGRMVAISIDVVLMFDRNVLTEMCRVRWGVKYSV